MDSFQLNKYAMAFLAVIFGVFSVSLISESLFHSKKPEQAGYLIEVADNSGSSTDAGGEPAKAYADVGPLLAGADMAAGEKVFKKCAACHTFDKGGKNKVGPNLYNIVDADIGKVDGFGYSKALLAYGEGKKWTYEELNGFLFKPKKYIKGTAMGFAGLKKDADRANLIGWLRTHADTPAPLPGS